MHNSFTLKGVSPSGSLFGKKKAFFFPLLLRLDLGDYLELDKNKMCSGYLLLAKSSNPRSFDLKIFLLGHRTL